MIKQAAIGLNSRSEANTFNEDGFLPLITAPMYSVVDESNYQVFLDNKIQVCLPRADEKVFDNKYFTSVSLDYFRATFVDRDFHLFREHPESIKVCIDTANGNMPLLHSSIREAKIKYKSSLIIMAGNVASVEAFVELAKTGVDYIRVGIGGGGGCNTTSNTGVGQENLGKLIKDCYDAKHQAQLRVDYPHSTFIGNQKLQPEDCIKISKVKIVADGISSYIKLCQDMYGFNDNGYAAINKLLFAGADLVMMGKLFAQCVESAGEKAIGSIAQPGNLSKVDSDALLRQKQQYGEFERCFVKYSGMSTQQEQLKYKPVDDERVLMSPSEGSVQWIPVRWTLNEWLNGSANQDEPSYLMGWVNSIKSAMSYTGKKTLS